MQPQSPDNNPYDFITESPTSSKKPLFGRGSHLPKIFLVLGILTAVTIIAVIAASLLGGDSGGSKTTYTRLLQQQTEIVRIADLASKDAQSSTVKNFAVTTSQTLQSTKADLTALAKSAGADIEPKTLLLGKDSATDKALTTAAQINNYDAVFAKILTDQLTEYSKTLQELLNSTPKTKSRNTLNSALDSVKILIKYSHSKTQ